MWLTTLLIILVYQCVSSQQSDNNGFYVNSGIKMCRLRNCTVAEDLSAALAKAGFTVLQPSSMFKTAFNAGTSLLSQVNSYAISSDGLSTSTVSGSGVNVQAYTQAGPCFATARVSSGTTSARAQTQFAPQYSAQYATQYAPYQVAQYATQYAPQYATQQASSYATLYAAQYGAQYAAQQAQQHAQYQGVQQAQQPQYQGQYIPQQYPQQQQAQPQQAYANSQAAQYSAQAQQTATPDLPADEDCVGTAFARINVTSELSILTRALDAIGAVDFLNDPTGSVTVFAPTDDAFQLLLSTLGEGDLTLEDLFDNTELLSTTVLLHVVPDVVALSTDLQSGQELTTLVPNQNLRVNIDDEGVISIIPPQELATADVIVPDVQACGAVIHVINGVLLSNPEEEQPEVAKSSSLAIPIAYGARKLQEQYLDQECTEAVQNLFYPCCEEYRLEEGEGICQAALKFDMSCDELRAFNDIEEGQNLFAGDIL